MTTRVKICGINSAESYCAAVEAGADWTGFVFFPPSPRYVTGAQAATIAGESGPPRVGLFVEPDAASVEAVLAEFHLDILQIYAGEKACREMRARFNLPVWRAIGVSTRADLPASGEGIDGLIIEAKPPKGADRPGGNAVAFDWSIMRGWRAPKPWLLAGGLTPENVVTAIRISGASAVDVSSGVETAPGAKSPEMISAFVRAAKSA